MGVTVSPDRRYASLMFIRISDVLVSHQVSPVTSWNYSTHNIAAQSAIKSSAR